MSSRPWALLVLCLLLPGCFSGGESGGRARPDSDRGGDGGEDEGPSSSPPPTAPLPPAEPTENGTGPDNATDPGAGWNATDPEDPADPQGNGTGPAPEPTPEEGPAEPMPKPPAGVGSWWKFTAVAPGYTHTLTRQVSALQERAGHETLRWDARKVIPSTGATITDDQVSWQRTADSAWVESQSTKTTDTDWGDFTSYTKTTFEPPCPDLQWPLSVGATWQTLCSYSRNEDGRTSSGSVLTNYTVVSFDQVIVPAGTFGAYRVMVETGGAARYDFYSPEACGLVRTQNGSGSYVLFLESYECKAA